VRRDDTGLRAFSGVVDTNEMSFGAQFVFVSVKKVDVFSQPNPRRFVHGEKVTIILASRMNRYDQEL
jgi:hypothetical protein